jgi:Fur family transcriptional regulator, peroxide stress response regulator
MLLIRPAFRFMTRSEKTIPYISKGTIYRNLKVLKEAGLISELNLDGTVSRFEAKKTDHYHFRCEQCGRVMDIDEPVNRALDKEVSARTGLRISNHQLKFRGLCRECQKK